ncbi:MAG: ribosome maturation factor RimP [Acidimicrobiales bacterium]
MNRVGDEQTIQQVRDLVGGPLAESGLELFDVEFAAGLLRVTIDQPGGLDTEVLDRASRLVSDLIDQADPVSAAYTLEVSSPGLERPLKTPAHFSRAVGSTVTVRTRGDGPRRIDGILESADETGVVIDAVAVAYDDIRSARTVFVWPGSGRTSRATARAAKSEGGSAPSASPLSEGAQL